MKVNIFYRPEEAMLDNWQKLVFNWKNILFFEKIEPSSALKIKVDTVTGDKITTHLHMSSPLMHCQTRPPHQSALSSAFLWCATACLEINMSNACHSELVCSQNKFSQTFEHCKVDIGITDDLCIHSLHDAEHDAFLHHSWLSPRAQTHYLRSAWRSSHSSTSLNICTTQLGANQIQPAWVQHSSQVTSSLHLPLRHSCP